MSRIIGLFSLLFVLFASHSTSAQAEAKPVPTCADRYYFILFAGSGDILRPGTAHVWATWVRATTLPDRTIQLHETTISFLPRTLRVRWWAACPEPGFNLGLQETFQFMTPNRGLRTRLSMWGPFEISLERYAQGINHKQHLDTGVVSFRSIDCFDQNDTIEHCLHAVTSAYPELDSLARRVRWYGDRGTAPIAAQLQKTGVVENCKLTHNWLIPALGLNRYPIRQRTCGEHWPFPLH